MARICFSTTLPPDVKESTVNGYTKYKLIQVGSQYYNEVIDAFDSLFKNRTYYFTGKSQECRKRITRNMSDLSSEFVVFDSIVPMTRVPVPFAPSKESVTGAYDLTKIKEKEFSSALDNFRLLKREVYAVLIGLSIIFILLIALKVHYLIQNQQNVKMFHIFVSPSRKVSPSYKQTTSTRRLRRQSIAIVTIYREIYQTLYGSCSNFKLVTFLISLLIFFVVAAFSGTYSTSRIVTQEPSVIESLIELIASETALPIFYNQQSVVSDEFERASVNSIKGQVWSKLMRSKVDLTTHIVDSLPLSFRGFASNIFREMEVNGSVIIADAEIARVFVHTICSTSPESELWHFVISTREDEREIILGWPFYQDFNEGRRVRLKIRNYFESGILWPWYLTTMDLAFEVGWDISGTSKKHKNIQHQACADPYSSASAPDHEDIAIEYYLTVSYMLSSIFCVAFMILVVEKSLSRKVKRKCSIREESRIHRVK